MTIPNFWSSSSGNTGMGCAVDVVAGIPKSRPSWERDDLGPIYARSAVVDDNNLYVYAFHNGGIVLNLDDGQLAWRYGSRSPEAVRLLTEELYIDGLKIFYREKQVVLCDLQDILSISNAEAMDSWGSYQIYDGAVYAFSPGKSAEGVFKIEPEDCRVEKLALDLPLLPLGVYKGVLTAYVVGDSELVGVDLDKSSVCWRIQGLSSAMPVLTYDDVILLLSEDGSTVSLFSMLDGMATSSHSIDLDVLSDSKVVKSWVQQSTSSFGPVISKTDVIYILNIQSATDEGELMTRRYFLNRDIRSGVINYSIELATEDEGDTRISLVAGDLVFGFDAEFLDADDNPVVMPDAWKQGYRRFCRPCAWDRATGEKVWEAADAFNSQLHCILSEEALVYIVEHQETVLCYRWREPYRSADLSQ